MKKLIAIFLAAIMCVSLLPVVAMAAEEPAIADGAYLIHFSDDAGIVYLTTDLKDGAYGYMKVYSDTTEKTDDDVDAADPASNLLFTVTNVAGGITIQDSAGKYIGMKGTYNSFNKFDEVGSNDVTWSVTSNDTGFTLTNVAKNKTIEYGSKYGTCGSYSDCEGTVLTFTKVTLEHTHDFSSSTPVYAKLDHFKHSVTLTCECGEPKAEDTYHSYEDKKCKDCGYQPEVAGSLTITEANAKGLEDNGKYTDKMYTITGKVTEIADTKYGNLYISDDQGNKLYVYGLYLPYDGDRFDSMETKPAVDDTIVIQAVLGAYKGTAQAKSAWLMEIKAPVADDDDTNDDNSGSEDTVTKPTTQKEIVDAAYALEKGKALEGEYTLTGKITVINTEYSEQYKNITVTIQVPGSEDKPIVCFRIKGDGAKDLAVGDTITVTGKLLNYDGTIEFDAGSKLDNVVKNNVPPTGDDLIAVPAIILMVLSVTGLAVMTFGKKKFF